MMENELMILAEFHLKDAKRRVDEAFTRFMEMKNVWQEPQGKIEDMAYVRGRIETFNERKKHSTTEGIKRLDLEDILALLQEVFEKQAEERENTGL